MQKKRHQRNSIKERYKVNKIEMRKLSECQPDFQPKLKTKVETRDSERYEAYVLFKPGKNDTMHTQ